MYDNAVIETFLNKQLQLFPEEVVYDREDALEFLEETMAFVAKDYNELKEYFIENADISGMSKEEILSQSEVFKIPDGRYLIVEG